MRFDDQTSNEPEHAASPTDRIIANLELHGYSPNRDEHDPRPLPEDDDISGAVTEIFGS